MSYMVDRDIKKLIRNAGYTSESHIEKILGICRQVRDFEETYNFCDIEWTRDEDTDLYHHIYSAEYEGFSLYINVYESIQSEWSVSADNGDTILQVGEDDPVRVGMDTAINMMKEKIATHIAEQSLLKGKS